MEGAPIGAVLRQLRTLFGPGTIGGLADARLVERYAEGRDEAAFAALVARHGPMVAGVCRDVLRSPHDAEDAFQATFLILARKAGAGTLSVGESQSLGGWLHRVARWVAVQANLEASRRRARERRAEARGEAMATADGGGAWDEYLPALHEEIGRLPEKYRAPIVLCDLGAMTREQAAGQLGWPPGTVAGRLARGRDLLRARLVRRGVAPSAGLAGGLLAARAAPAAVPDAWAERAVGAASRVGAGGKLAAGTASAAAIALMEGVMKAMNRAGFARAALGLASLIVVVSVAALGVALASAVKEEPAPARSLVGKVVDGQGRPVAGASVWLPVSIKGRDDRSTPVVSDDEGKFALPIREEWLAIERYSRMGIVWANAPGHSLGVAQAYRMIWGDDRSELTVRLGPATGTSFSVVGPDGLPLAGARVEPYLVKTPMAYMFPPKGMLPDVATTTDAKGIARLPALDRRGFMTVLVEAEGYGRQTQRLGEGADEPAERTVRLRPIGRVEGRVVADRAEAARGIELFFTTEERGQTLLVTGTEGHAHVVTDDRGGFSVPALAAGELKIDASMDRSLPLRLRLPDRLVIRPGETNRVDIPLEPAVKVRGVVRAGETGVPLAGARISVGYGLWRQSDSVTSGADGRYEAYVVPGKVTLHVISLPDGYVQLGAPWAEPVNVPGPDATDLPPIELVKEGPAIKGKLVDGRDRPLAGVQVIGTSGNRRYGFARTDAAGVFAMKGVPAGIALEYTAWAEEEPNLPTEVVSAEPLVLRTRLRRERVEEAGAAGTVSARVVDRAGAPVVGVGLVLYETVRDANGRIRSGRYHVLGITDAQGRLRAEYPTRKGDDYRIIVQPGTVAIDAGETIRADGRTPVAFPPIVVGRLRTIEGRVVDADGRPVPGATVRNWGNDGPLTTASGDADGGFRLGGVPAGDVFLFAEAPGYRFEGRRVAPGERPVRLVLRRRDGPPGRTLSRLGPAIPRKEAADLARKLITPYAERALAGDDRDASARALEVLALIDPRGAWEKILAGDKTWDRDAAKIAVVRALRGEQPDDALAALSLIKTPFWRLDCYEGWIDDLPADQAWRERPLLDAALLDAALLEARKLDNPGLMAHFLAHLGRRLADSGDAATAREVVAEALPLARAVDAGNGRGDATRAVAAALGRVDAKAALALIPEGGDERQRNDMLGTVAEAIAAADPAGAERLLGRFTYNSSSAFSVHACHRMAPVDLPRARRLAAAIKSDGLRAYAYGLMADAVGGADRGAADGLLDESRRAFDDDATRGLGGPWEAAGAAVMAASLLPVVERVAPDRLDEFLWHAVSLRWHPRSVNDLTRTIPDTSRFEAMKQGAGLALFLARYDRDLARAVLGPVVDGLLALPAGEDVDRLEWRLILMALAQVDPRRSAEVVAALSAFRERSDRGVRDQAPREAAHALAEDLEQTLERARARLLDLELLLREDR